MGALLSPFPPVRNGLGALARLPGVGGLSFVQMMLSPARSLADRQFRGVAAKMLIAGNAAHSDIPMDAPGSGVMGWLLAMIGQHLGYPVPVGGAGALSGAMVRRLESVGGRVVITDLVAPFPRVRLTFGAPGLAPRTIVLTSRPGAAGTRRPP